ncbi:hypothetical protein EDD86DRAFT_204234 [Gorgonomyces haynaldii]|nr:hypothetical protein EDD86DRAFT_204234 [Gorgonomyces haynaldii]
MTPHKKQCDREEDDFTELVDGVKIREDRIVNGFFSILLPNGISDPYLVICTHARDMGLDPALLKQPSNLPLLAGQTISKDTLPYSMNYSGHQYGFYIPQLGSGRTTCLGEYLADDKRWELQLKGTGPNCYSRGGDGRMTLSQALREFMIAEACHNRKMPTTRSVAVLGGKDTVMRKGELRRLGILVRNAPSWIRFGTFELFHYREQPDMIKELADFLIETHFSDAKVEQKLVTRHLLPAAVYPKEADGDTINPYCQVSQDPIEIALNSYACLFRSIVRKSAVLVAHWQAQGFVHGLLNTDHCSVLGLTMVTEKSGFMESYDPEWTPNQTDHERDFRFELQPSVMKWNLSRLGRCFLDLVGDSWAPNQRPKTREFESVKESATGEHEKLYSLPPRTHLKHGFLFHAGKSENIIRELLQEFEPVFLQNYHNLMLQKLGLEPTQINEMDLLIQPLIDIFAESGVDYQLFFQLLVKLPWNSDEFANAVAFDENGKHDQDTLIQMTDKPEDIMTLVLHSLAQLIEQDEPFVVKQPVRASLSKRRESKITMIRQQKVDDPSKILDQQNKLPSLVEMASRVRYWAMIFQTRLQKQEIPYEEWQKRVQSFHSPVASLDALSKIEDLVNSDDPQLYTFCESLCAEIYTRTLN